MTTYIKLSLAGIAVAAAVHLAGCSDIPANLVVTNDYPADPGSNAKGPLTMFKVWWTTTLIAEPIAPAATSAEARTVPGADFAYALLAPGWVPESGSRPAVLIALHSTDRLVVSRGGQLEIRISDDTFAGNCAAGQALDEEAARIIVERIFPGDFAGTNYDPATCTTRPADGDAGVQADAGAD